MNRSVIRAPHAPQKRWSAGFCAPQETHAVTAAVRAVSRRRSTCPSAS
ncbi:MAG: hypothetical protein M5U28_27770 [Sandaracinaceae bacterium]|nr:hypothetical protein [Sandaracinaceae bacterium]